MSTNRFYRPSHSDVAKQESQRSWEGLRITILKFEKTPLVPHGVPVPDLIYWSGFIVISVQMLIAIVPWILHGHWDTFMITAIGNMLAVAGSSLPIWRQEKWACPKKGGSAVTITQGNGSRHAITVMGSETSGLDLEILARGTRVIRAASRWDRLLTALLALLWVFLLVTVAGMHQDTWCMFGYDLYCFLFVSCDQLTVPRLVCYWPTRKSPKYRRCWCCKAPCSSWSAFQRSCYHNG